MTSVGIEIVNEIERVSAKRERWRGYERDADGKLGLVLGIALMTAAIDEAKHALRGADPLRAIKAYQALRGYNDDD